MIEHMQIRYISMFVRIIKAIIKNFLTYNFLLEYILILYFRFPSLTYNL